MSFQNLLTEDRRLVVLRFLAEDPGYRLNTSLLQSALDRFGHSVSRDQIATDAAWLREQGLVTIEDLGPVQVLALTSRGLDVATGRAVTPGVKRPSPRG